MIAGPELLQDRTHVLELLLHHPEVVERDLALVERDVELGGRHLLDGLMRDATGRPTLLFVAGRNEQADFPARVVDASLWVRDNIPLLRRFLGDSGILWELPARCLVICPECEPGLVRRLETVAGIDLDLMELRSIRIRNQNCWAAVPRLSRGAGARPLPAGPAAESAPVSPQLSSVWQDLLDRLARIDRELVLDGDRYSSEVAWRGELLARLRLRTASILVEFPAAGRPRVPDGEGEVLIVQDARAAAAVVDRVLRRFLALQAAARSRPEAGRGGAAALRGGEAAREVALPELSLPDRGELPGRLLVTDHGAPSGPGSLRSPGPVLS